MPNALKFILVGLLAVLGIGYFFFSDPGYGKVSNTTYRAATALYSAALAKSAIRLDAVSDFLDEQPSDAVPQHELVWLQEIIELGKNGEWDAAAHSAKRIMEDQIER